MRILVTGAGGFVGGQLCLSALRQGMTVIGLARSTGNVPAGMETVRWQLGEAAPEHALAGVQCAYHLAHDFDGSAGARRTIDGSLRLAAQLREAGVRRQIFFSSYSAGQQARSQYAQVKNQLEVALAEQFGALIVRPGLVMGSGGIYGRIQKWARILPAVPLPSGGKGRVPVIAIQALCNHTLALASAESPPAEVNCFEPDLRSLRELVLDAAAEAGRRPWIIPVPAVALRYALMGAAALKIPLPVNADNLAGFLANQEAHHVPMEGI